MLFELRPCVTFLCEVFFVKKPFLILVASVVSTALAQTNSWNAAVSVDFSRTVMPDLSAGLSAILSAPISGGNAASLTLEPNWKWTFIKFVADDLSGNLYASQNAPLTLSRSSSFSLTSKLGLNLAYGFTPSLALRTTGEAGFVFGLATIGIAEVNTSNYLRTDLRLEYGAGAYSVGAGAEVSILPSSRVNYFAKASYDVSRQISLTARYDTNFQGFNLALTSLYRLTGDSNLEGLLETSNAGEIRARLKLGLTF